MPKILKFSQETIEICSHALRQGKLVSFPTETVYGLGANAFDEQAIESVYLAKSRPSSDPLIVHVSSLSLARTLVQLSSDEERLFIALAEFFWPGPLTLVVRASSSVLKRVMAGGDFVALRMPKHAVALALLNSAGFPLVAPSANRFGHVSPTTALHVLDDFSFLPDLKIIDSGFPCEVGIESTVLKISSFTELSILRPGFIGSKSIECFLREKNFDSKLKNFTQKIVGETGNAHFLESPGQRLTHYAPELETFILLTEENFPCREVSQEFLSQSVFIDFGGKNLSISKYFLYYFDLSLKDDVYEACKNIFSLLRKAEKSVGAKSIVISYISPFLSENHSALYDRIFRSASGSFIRIKSL